MTNCPSEETLAAFIDRRLDPEARRRVIEHMASCGDCREIVLAAGDIRAAEAIAKPFRATKPLIFRISGVAASLAAAALLVVLYGPQFRQRLFPTDMDDVVDGGARLRYRPSSARLSANFPYRETKPTLRTAERDTTDDSEYARLWAVTAQIQDEADGNPSIEQQHALGVSYLLEGNRKAAITALEEALRRQTKEKGQIIEAIRHSHNAALLNDLAAAYQTLMEREGKLEVQPLAVEAVRNAWALEKTPQIAWTRAVVIESLHVREASIAAWRDYLELEPRSRWSEDARERLNTLLQPTDTELWPAVRDQLLASGINEAKLRAIVDRFRQEARLWCEDELLPQWGEAVLAGDSSAPQRLEQLALIGRALEQSNGEGGVIEVVEALRRAPPSLLAQLAQGHIAFGAGRRATIASEPAEAVREFDIAVAALPSSLTPFSLRVRTEHSAAVYLTNDYQRARAEIQGLLEQEASSQLSNASRGRIHTIAGVLYLQLGLLRNAAEHYAQAADAFGRAGERDYEATLQSRLAEALEDAGLHEEARDHRMKALLLLERTGNPKHRHDVMIETAYVAIGNGQEAVADLLLDTLVVNSVAARDYVQACTSLMWRSAYRYRRGLLLSAGADLSDAQRVCRSIPDANVRERSFANLELARAALRSDNSNEQDLAGLDAAVNYYERTQTHAWLKTAYFARARRLVARGDPAGAERDYRTALNESEATREKIDERLMRISFTATTDEIVDGYVEFLLQQGRDQEAFEIADRSRFREFVDSPGARWNSTGSSSLVDRIQASLGPGTSLVEYRVLRKAIVAWVVTADSFNTVTLPVPLGEAKQALAEIQSDMPAAAFRARAAFLYDALVRPLEPLIRDSTVLAVIPDDDLERLPYSALYDRVNAQYVAERRATAMAPSAALFMQSEVRARERLARDEQMVVVEATSGGANVTVLPEATTEAQSIAALYPHAVVIDSFEKAASGVLSQARNASLLHFVGHTQSTSDFSTRALRLGDGGDSMLRTTDILAASLPKLRLAYLSACETDQGPVLKAEGSMTLARSFFAAGVPIVVATLWPVDDSIARVAANSFYGHLRDGSSPAEALRQAQVALLARNPAARADWAAFRVIGAGI